MALTCSTTAVQYEDFEFIDCSTISISYNSRGEATVSFSVVSTRDTLMNDYTNMTFGGVNFKLYVRDVSVSLIPGTLVYTYQFSMTGTGC